MLIIISSDFREGNTSLLYTGLMDTRALTLKYFFYDLVLFLNAAKLWNRALQPSWSMEATDIHSWWKLYWEKIRVLI